MLLAIPNALQVKHFSKMSPCCWHCQPCSHSLQYLLGMGPSSMTPTHEGVDCSYLNSKPFLGLMQWDTTTNISFVVLNHLFCHPWWPSDLLKTLCTIPACNTHLFCTCLMMWEQCDTNFFLLDYLFLCWQHDPLLPSTKTSHDTHK